MTEQEQKEQDASRYRFSGYQLNLVQLDETGPSYVLIYDVHPYYKNQPLYWQTNAYRGKTLGTTEIIGPIQPKSIAVDSGYQKGNLIDLLDF